jgi:hypothetical protein
MSEFPGEVRVHRKGSGPETFVRAARAFLGR